MTYIYIPYIWLFIGTTVVNLLMIFHMLKKRNMNGASAFIFALLFSFIWCVGTAMEISAVELENKLFWTKVGYIAYAFSPLAWIVMVMQITDQWHWRNQRRKIWFCSIPVITVMLAWTNDFHSLIWQHATIDPNDVLHALALKHGLWFWVHATYSDGLNLLSVFLTIRFWRSKAPLYGKQFKYLAFSMIFVMFVNGTYVLRIGPNIDTTSIAWGIASLFIMWALFQNKLFDLMPIARNRIMESMAEGIVVMDLKNRIVDMNPSAKCIFQSEAIKSIGCDAYEFFEGWPKLQKVVIEEKKHMEFEQRQNQKSQYYDASYMPIKNEREILLGKLLIIRDVTKKKMTENELLLKQQEIAVKEERERMARDLHDNLGQILGFVNVQTQAIKQYVIHDRMETAVQCLERLTEVAQHAHNTVRETILSMREESACSENKGYDFFMELNRQASLFEKNYDITAEIHRAKVDAFNLCNSRVMMQIMNIIKESLNNIVKHSGASTVKILFEENLDQLQVCIIDNGCGFDVENKGSNSINKYGLLCMKERAEEIGGCLSIHSQIGKGTTVKIQIPKQHLFEAANNQP